MKRHMRILFICSLAWLFLTFPDLSAAQETQPPTYEMRFEAQILPTQREARARWVLGSGASNLHELRLRIDPERHANFQGAGSIEVDGHFVTWKPPKSGGTLSYRFRIDDVREDGGYDARCSDDWAIFRGDDLFPPAHTITEAGALSLSTLRLRLPTDWSSTTRFKRIGRHTYRAEDPNRRFDRPTGWIVIGRLATLREKVAGSRLAISGPVGQGVRRHDILAFLRWNLPDLRALLGKLPERLLIVSAGDPMWRGGLSGPASTFIHTDRPLITHDGSSPLLHELFHATTRLIPGEDGDWIVEGLAEYYSIELMARSRSISRRRADKTFRRFAERGTNVRLEGRSSSGAATARAVTVFRSLDRELRERSKEEHHLDDVVLRLVGADEAVTTQTLQKHIEQLSGSDFSAFFRREIGKVRVPKKP